MYCKLTTILIILLAGVNVVFGSIYDLENLHPKTSADGRITVDYIVDDNDMPIAQHSVDSGEFNILPMPGEDYYGWPSEISSDGTTIEGTVFEDVGSERQYRAAYWEQIDQIEGIPQYDCHIFDLPEGFYGHSSASDMSANGEYFVGRSEDSEGYPHACLWEIDESVLDLGYLVDNDVESNFNRARAVSNNKIIVGDCWWMQLSDTDPEKALGFIWDELNGMRYIKDVLEQEYGYDFGNSTLTSCRHISTDGIVLAGDGLDQSGEWFEWTVTIPEPGTLFLFGLGCFIFRERRREPKSQSFDVNK